IGHCLALLAQSTIAELSGDDETAFHDTRKNQHRHCLVPQGFCTRRMIIEIRQRRFSVAVDLAGTGRQRHSRRYAIDRQGNCETECDCGDLNSDWFFHEVSSHHLSPSTKIQAPRVVGREEIPRSCTPGSSLDTRHFFSTAPTAPSSQGRSAVKCGTRFQSADNVPPSSPARLVTPSAQKRSGACPRPAR